MAGRKKSVIDGLLYIINIVVAVALLLSYLAYYFDPELTTFFAFFGLAYPVLLLLNVLFILYWALRLKVKIVLSLVCIGIGYMHVLRFYQFSGQHKVVNPDETLKVMTYNLRQFNKFAWLDLPNVQEEIVALVNEEKPDVLLVQEYQDGESSPDFGFPYRYQTFPTGKKASGMVIFSKIPFEKTGAIQFGIAPDSSDAGQALYADISFNGKLIRLINTHLASVGFDRQEYQRLENPNEGDQEEIKRDFAKIYRQLKDAFAKRSYQTKVLENAVESSPHPVILGGDFNDTPHGYVYHRINLQLKDSYMEAGYGWPRTFVKGPIPFRIDFLFHEETLNPISFEIINKELSDHYPVVTELEWQ